MMPPADRRGFLRDGGAALLVAALGAHRPDGGSAKTPPVPPGWHGLDDDVAGQVVDVMSMAPDPGLALACVSNGSVGPVRGFGVLQAGTDTPVAPETVFEAGSLGKPVFAYAVLRLRDEGIIDLDRPLAEYFPLPDVSDPRAQAITARHVLSHSSGLGNWRQRDTDRLTFGFAPGQRFAYSGEGYFYLQRVVERLTGKGIADLMRERVFEPLDMLHSTYVWTPAVGAALATGHTPVGTPRLDGGYGYWGPRLWAIAEQDRKPLVTWTYDDAARALPRIRPTAPVVPDLLMPNVAGSLFTTAGDYARFLGMLLDAHPRPITALSSRSYREMLSRQIGISSSLGWGLGWGLEHESARDFIWHWGDMGDYTAFVLAEPHARTGVVIFTNAGRGLDVCRWIVEKLTATDHRAFVFVSNPLLSAA
jgi:CubicO group peptidase (beta-lactamase class C family)